MDEQKKYELIKRFVDEGETGNKNRIAFELGISRRQVNRLIIAYKERGKAAFIHGNKGKKPAITTAPEIHQKVIDLYRTKYYDANFVHFTELLASNEGIKLSVSTVSSILEAEGIYSPRLTKKKKKRIKKELEEAKKAAKTKKEADRIQANLVNIEDASIQLVRRK